MRMVKSLKGAVHIGRPGIYGNPSAIGKVCPECGQIHRTGGSTLKCFRKYLVRRVENDPQFRKTILALRNKDCYCPGCKGRTSLCHGQVIRTWLHGHRIEAEEYNDGCL
jgi:hypothetical protein